MKVSEIWVYPIKGLGGQKVESAFASESGFKNDRRFMLVDTNNRFISQRSHSKMARLAVKLTEGYIHVTDKIDSSVSFRFSVNDLENNSEFITIVWKSKVESIGFHKYINDWFSNFLGDQVKLVGQKEIGTRKRSIPFKTDKIGMSFADGYPYLVLSKASVRDLSSRVDTTVDYRQFRANIIIEDSAAYEEDMLSAFSLSNSSFKMVKPCKRCPVININQDTGETSINLTKEIVKYRRSGNAVIFGMNAANMKEGIVNVGDVLNLS